MNNGDELCKFTVGESKGHSECNVFCVRRGAPLCLGQDMKQYLQNNKMFYSLAQSKDASGRPRFAWASQLHWENKSDWDYLLEACEEKTDLSRKKIIMDKLSSSKLHRLRFKNNKEKSISFVNSLLGSTEAHFSSQEVRDLLAQPLLLQAEIWGKCIASAPQIGDYALKRQDKALNLYKRHFAALCEKVEAEGPLGIYRLDGLIERGIPKLYKNEHMKFLSLLYAFGFPLVDAKNMPQSVSELVAKYQFFLEFSEGTSSYFSQLLKTKKNKIDSLRLLSSEEVYKRICCLWNSFCCVTSSLKMNQSQPLNDPVIKTLLVNGNLTQKSDHPQALRQVLCSPLRQALNVNRARTIPIGFKNTYESVIHPFKHIPQIHEYFSSLKEKQGTGSVISRVLDFSTQSEYTKLAWDVTVDYLRMILEIIDLNNIVKTAPLQVGIGTNFTYEYTPIGSSTTFRVITSSSANKITHILTCF